MNFFWHNQKVSLSNSIYHRHVRFWIFNTTPFSIDLKLILDWNANNLVQFNEFKTLVQCRPNNFVPTCTKVLMHKNQMSPKLPKFEQTLSITSRECELRLSRMRDCVKFKSKQVISSFNFVKTNMKCVISKTLAYRVWMNSVQLFSTYYKCIIKNLL